MSGTRNEQLLAKYGRYARNARLLLLPVGLWPAENDGWAYRLLAAFLAASLLLLSFTGLHYCYINVADVNRLIRGFSWCLSNWTMLIKVILFVVHRDRLLDLNATLGKIFEQELRSLGLEPLLLQRLLVFTGIYYTMILALAVAFTLFAAIPLAFAITERKFLLVFPGKYPFEIEPCGTLYWLLYSYECLLAGLFFCVGCGTDAAFGLWVFRLSAELRLLSRNFAELRPGQSYAAQLRYCLDKREMIVRCRDHLQQVFGFIVVWLYVTISLVLCEYIYRISKMTLKFSLSQIVMFFTFSTKFLQAFTYAYCGSVIVIESDKLQQAIYNCQWPGSGNKRIMRDVLSLLTQRPIDLRSYNYFRISMEMFLKIINSAVSYFFLLRTLESG